MPIERKPPPPFLAGGKSTSWILVAAAYVAIVRILIVRVPWCAQHALTTTALVGVVACAAILAFKWVADEQSKGG
jgi:hypothetical protein